MAGLIGSPIEDLDTPALLLDKSATDRNIRKMADYFQDKACRLRPHFKNHKCITLARYQLKGGSAVGITCAKLGEAEILAQAGFADVLIANQIVGTTKVRRLVELACHMENLRVAVDHIDQVTAISDAAASFAVNIGLLIEVDIGMARCGVPPGPQGLELARQIVKLNGVRFDGLQAYEGHLVDLQDMSERRRRTLDAIQQAIGIRDTIEKDGIPVHVISGGSTSTYAITSQIDGINEIQAGTYPTMDWMYQRLTPEFELSLSVIARVISRPKPDVAVLDVGFKGLGHEFGPPKVKGHMEKEFEISLAEEHCIVRNSLDWRMGQTIELIPSHACTTCNLYRQFHVHEQNRLVEIWPIEGSGKLN